jgi:MFS family permease
MDRVAQQAGGPARRSVVIILACVLGLGSADSATVGAIAAPLQSDWHIGNAEIGLLVSVTSFAGALGPVPAGFLADRMDRYPPAFYLHSTLERDDGGECRGPVVLGLLYPAFCSEWSSRSPDQPWRRLRATMSAPQLSLFCVFVPTTF